MSLFSVQFRTLYRREVERFLSVVVQTLVAPMISATLYMVIFGLSLGDRLVFHDLPYRAFLVPGLVMMAVVNNAFQNTASSLMFGKYEGSLQELLVAPISYLEMALALMLGGVSRGVLVGLGVWAVCWPLSGVVPHHPAFAAAMGLAAAASFALLGMLGAIWADRWDGVSAVSTFVILPLTYLGGVFYSLDILPATWQQISTLNPLLYMVDGLRYGFLGRSDLSPAFCLAVTFALAAVLFAVVLGVLKSGWKLRP